MIRKDVWTMEGKKRKLVSNYLLTEEQNDSVEIRFESKSSEKKYRFFEVSQSLLLEMGQGCRIVGDDSSEAVLCTSSATYSIKKVETSNSIYLVPPSSQPHIYWLTPPHREYYEVHIASFSSNFETQGDPNESQDRKTS
jgi:hypothetical protein